MELLSRKTEKRDIYRDNFRAVDFFLLDRRDRLHGYRLVEGVYVLVPPDSRGHISCASLDLSLGVVDGYPATLGGLIPRAT